MSSVWLRLWCLGILTALASSTGNCPPDPVSVPDPQPPGWNHLCFTTPPPKTDGQRPNIVIILADDLGWNDVSFHGSNQFMTPNIDALAFSGVILRDYYTQPICTPARAALLTARHPIRNGMENDVLYAPEPWGLPLRERLMPQYLRELGYRTHAVGKWHLGFFRSNYTPTKRGFDSHFGLWLGQQDHYTHVAYEDHPGYDFRRDMKVFWEAKGKYAADLFTEEAERIIHDHNETCPLFLYVPHIAPHAPLQAPQETIDRFRYIKDKKRQTFAAMVTKVDESVGRIVQALRNKGMLDNSIVLFLTDNGGATHGFNGNVASNYPLKGGKDTLWEGGVRGVGLVWSPLLQNVPRVHRGLVNVQDWLPTLLTAIGADDHEPNRVTALDGVSQWAALDGRAPPPYRRMLHNIDPVRKIAAIRYNQWKLVVGRTYNGMYDGHYGQLTEERPYEPDALKRSPAGRAVRTLPDNALVTALRVEATIDCQADTTGVPHVVQLRRHVGSQYYAGREMSKNINTTECRPQVAPCLFDVEKDPCETRNLAKTEPEVVLKLVEMLMEYSLAEPNNQAADNRSFPENWNNTWVPWQDCVPPRVSQIF